MRITYFNNNSRLKVYRNKKKFSFQESPTSSFHHSQSTIHRHLQPISMIASDCGRSISQIVIIIKSSRFQSPILGSSLLITSMDSLPLNLMINCSFPRIYGDKNTQWNPLFIWMDLLGIPQPPFKMMFLLCMYLLTMSRLNPISHSMSEIMLKL